MKSNESLNFRFLQKNDIDEVLFILEKLSGKNKFFFHPHDFNIETLNENLNSSDHYFVLTLNEKIIGYSFLRLFGYEIPSFGFCIRNDYENKGYGTIITELTIEKGRKLGYSEVILKTHKENIPAQKIYKKVGFSIIGETKDKKQIRMEKIL